MKLAFEITLESAPMARRTGIMDEFSGEVHFWSLKDLKNFKELWGAGEELQEASFASLNFPELWWSWMSPRLGKKRIELR